MTQGVVGYLFPIDDPLSGSGALIDWEHTTIDPGWYLPGMTPPTVLTANPSVHTIFGFLFQITETRIGTQPLLNWRDTLISQYDMRPTIGRLIDNFNNDIDPTIDFDYLYDNVWNLDTAVGYGLDVWGRIVGVGRVLQVAGERYLGFAQQLLTVDPFGVSPWYSGASLTSNFRLSDTAYRKLIIAKALSNISDGSIQSLNKILMTLFPDRGNAYVVDGLDMTMKFVFHFVLSPVEIAIVTQSGVFPRTPGVSLSYEVIV